MSCLMYVLCVMYCMKWHVPRGTIDWGGIFSDVVRAPGESNVEGVGFECAMCNMQCADSLMFSFVEIL